MKAQIEIYTGAYCPYCQRAKALLRERGLAFVEYDVQREPARREEMLQRAHGARTIPQIFINGRHVGGCDDLYALDRAGKLEEWLRSA
ncbi:MAG: glutaredoxin 3 [Zetaproteobacteria bacterium]|nr:MAG: glutaredoxin 3 [Zetaproteobacteria bacterium]